MKENKRIKTKQTSFILSRVFSSGENKHENIIFTDYFSARKAAKKIIHESINITTDEANAKKPDHDQYKEIAPDHWISESETIIISTFEINN